MTHLTVEARAKTYPLDYLLDARRRGVAICLFCSGEQRPPLGSVLCVSCGAFLLRDPNDIIITNWSKP